MADQTLDAYEGTTNMEVDPITDDSNDNINSVPLGQNCPEDFKAVDPVTNRLATESTNPGEESTIKLFDVSVNEDGVCGSSEEESSCPLLASVTESQQLKSQQLTSAAEAESPEQAPASQIQKMDLKELESCERTGHVQHEESTPREEVEGEQSEHSNKLQDRSFSLNIDNNEVLSELLIEGDEARGDGNVASAQSESELKCSEIEESDQNGSGMDAGLSDMHDDSCDLEIFLLSNF